MPAMQPDDIGQLVDVADPRISPDGATIAFVVTNPDVGDNLYRSSVWTVPADGSSPPQRLSPGLHRDAKPRWSPDGRSLAYVTQFPDKRRQLIVQAMDGSGCIEVLEWPDEVDEVVWSPDGSRLAFTARLRDESRYAHEKPQDQPPRRIERLTYRLDSVGWIVDRPKHVFVVPAETGAKASQLTTGPFEHGGATWSPDGTKVAFTGARHETWDRDLATDLFVVDAEGGEPVRLTETGPTHSGPSWAPDGELIAFVRGDRSSFPRNGQIGVVPASGGGERVLTGALDRNCAPYLLPAREPVWRASHLLFQVEDRGNLHLYRVASDGGHGPELVLGGDRMVLGFDQVGDVLAFVATRADASPDLYVARDGRETRLTTFGDTFSASCDLSTPEPFTAISADGTEVDAWIMRPVGAEPGRRYPTLLNIHGGPFSQYGNKLFDEFQVQAGAGFAVVYCNPRGSSGRSEVFGRQIRGPKAGEDPGTGWGGADYDDLMAVVDAAVERFDFVDPERLGVLGGSYGGFMTSWIVGHSDRFAAACSERAVNNMLTMCWNSDIGHYFGAGYLGVSPLDDPEEFVRQSPSTYARDMRTPLLILHSEDDLRCPISQAEELFVALKLLDRKVEFVRFAGESHELSRSGSPRHRVQRLEVILDFFARHLQNAAN